MSSKKYWPLLDYDPDEVMKEELKELSCAENCFTCFFRSRIFCQIHLDGSSYCPPDPDNHWSDITCECWRFPNTVTKDIDDWCGEWKPVNGVDKRGRLREHG